jgi:HK97 family phage prohead protease/HK97 family phage major capsid protein
MNKIFNLTSTFKSHESDDGSVMIRGMASTADFDRAGDSISCEAWQKGGLSNFEKNPIILFNHDYDKPIGRATGLKAGPNGLELEAKISKAAPANVAQLVKDGVLGAFSVGFRVKDADYLEETDGLKIKDAELFEVSVVSVPCNQSATFSLAKSFDSMDEYNEFKKTFTNRVDLAGQSLAKDEVNTSSIASDAPKSAEKKSADQEIKMDNQNIDLEAFAKKVAEDTAAKIAMKQAEQKAAEEAKAKAAQEADEAKALEAESIKSVVTTGINAGVEALMADVEAKLTEKDAKMDEVISSFKKELEEKEAEITAMNSSKRQFADRGGNASADISKWGQDFMQAKMLGTITGKGFNTDYGQGLLEKAGVDYTSHAADIDQEVSSLIEKEIQDELKVARLFREITVNGKSTVLPVQPDGRGAAWANTAEDNLFDRGGNSASSYQVQQVIMNAHRLVSNSFIENDVDEAVLVNLMPMIIDSLARAHAREVETSIINGQAGVMDGLLEIAPETGANLGAASLTGSAMLSARTGMGRFGVNPSDVTYIVGQDGYYDLLKDPDFQSLDEVGSDLAARVTGQIGSVFGSPIVVSEEMPADSGSATACVAVYNQGFVIPRLRGVTVETDYEVQKQRKAIVASQSLGFTSIYAGADGAKPTSSNKFETGAGKHAPAVRIDFS